jgi:hypothetical protein
MKLKSGLLGLSTALTLFAGAAFAAIDGTQLAADYLAEGYDFVEVKVGPTQTKVEAIRGATKVEVIYDNATLAILKQEREAADSDDVGRTGSQVRTVSRDFEDDDKDDDGRRGRGGRDDDEDDDDGDDDDRGRGSDDDDNDDDDDDDDNSGHGSDGDDDDDGDDD